MARKQSGKGLVLMGLVAGAAIGWALGAVYADQSGDENRKRLEEWTSHRAGEAQSKVQEKLPGIPGRST